jgi:hypothetical protein
MSYRDSLEALRARRAALESQLADARAAKRESDERAKQITTLERELLETTRMLGGAASPTKRLLDTVHVAAPCTARWEDMQGDERVRHCAQCSTNVYNLSAMPRAEAEAFLREREGPACIRLYRRADGTTMTSDCPVGVRRRRRRRVAVGAVAAGTIATSAALAGAFSRTSPLEGCHLPSSGRYEMGAVGPAGRPNYPPPSPAPTTESDEPHVRTTMGLMAPRTPPRPAPESAPDPAKNRPRSE